MCYDPKIAIGKLSLIFTTFMAIEAELGIMLHRKKKILCGQHNKLMYGVQLAARCSSHPQGLDRLVKTSACPQ